jgi:hypothetical protein
MGGAAVGGAAVDGAAVDGVRLGLRVMAGVLGVLALVVAGSLAATAETLARTGPTAALAGAALIAVAAALAAGAYLTRQEPVRGVAASLCVLAVAIAGARYVAVIRPDQVLLGVAVVASAVATLAWLATRPWRSSIVHSGATAGGLVALVAMGLTVTGLTVVAAARTVARAQPAWHASLAVRPGLDLQLLAAIGLTAAAAVLLGRGYRTVILAGSAMLAVLALPDSVPLPWWGPSTVDVGVAAILLLGVLLPRPRPWTDVSALAAAALAVDGLLVGLARPSSTAAVLTALAVLGVVAAAIGHRSEVTRTVAGTSLLVGFLAVPPAVGSALVAADQAGVLDVPAWWLARSALVSVGMLVAGLVAVRRWTPSLSAYGYAAVLGSAAVWPQLAIAVAPRESFGVYGGLSLLLIALALLAHRPAIHSGPLAAAGGAAVPGGLLFAAGVLPALAVVLGGPYGWLDAVWTRSPIGTGLTPSGDVSVVEPAAAWSLGLLALASATVTYALTRRWAAALGGLGLGGPTAVLVAVVAARAPWPAVPATMLALGLLVLVVAAVAPVSTWRTATATVQGALYLGAGLAGALAVKWSTITALASIVVTAAVVGVVGRTIAWRIAGWLGAVVAAFTLAGAVGRAAELSVRDTAPLVLATAAIALALGAVLARVPAVPRTVPAGPAPDEGGAPQAAAPPVAGPAAPPRPGDAAVAGLAPASAAGRLLEGRAVSAAAHAGAVVAILLAAGWPGMMAALSAAWGVAVGLRALWPGTTRAGRAGLAAGAGAWELVAWWLLLDDRGVTLVEAYTVPLALVGLLAGTAAVRARPDLHSWVAYGPALAAGFLPSLALALASDPTPARRLLLGMAALVVVMLGAVRRRQAPVVSGGIVLILLALHEVPRVWDLLPRWIPLAAGGLLLVGLAITYERRRRDLARLRAAVARMT